MIYARVLLAGVQAAWKGWRFGIGMTWDQWLFLIGICVAFATVVETVERWLSRYRK